MRVVTYEKLESQGKYGAPEKKSALRVGLATQEERSTLELAATKKVRVYVLGRSSALAHVIKAGDRLDERWHVQSIDASPKGQLLVTAQENKPKS